MYLQTPPRFSKREVFYLADQFQEPQSDLRSGKNMTGTICVLASLAMTKQQKVWLQQSNQTPVVKQYDENVLSPTHLTTGVAKLPAAVEVWGGWHGVANAGHADVGEGEVDDDEVGGRAQLLELHKHHQHHDVAG